MTSLSASRLHDVVIAGAGPVGLFLACELALAKLDVLVLERDDSPEAPLKAPPLGTGVLVDFDGSKALRQAMAPWSDRIRCAASRARNASGLAALMVRPDGFVAWASDTAPAAGDVEAAATRWFGSPGSVAR